jgi:mRNA interferase RelE/StbE
MAPDEAPRYRVEFTRPAIKELQDLPRNVQERILARAEALAINPRTHGTEKLSGADDLYRIRVGTYRVVYQIQDDALRVLIVRVGHRKDVYRDV